MTLSLLTCKGKGVIASGYGASQGFVVKGAAQAVGETVPSMQQHVHGVFDLQQELIENGVLQREASTTPEMVCVEYSRLLLPASRYDPRWAKVKAHASCRRWPI